jgi:hypothetical protein
LQKTPHPTLVRAEYVDGAEKSVRLGDSTSRWRDAEGVIGDAVRCEALDSDGCVLRVWETPDAALLERSQVPNVPQAKSELAEFARILADSSDRAALRNAEAYKLAFEQQCLLVNVLSSRLSSLEKAWHQLLMAQQSPEPDVDPNSGMVAALLGMAGMHAPPSPAGNGAK